MAAKARAGEAVSAAIDPKVVKRVIALRKQGQTWGEVLEAIGEERPFVLRVRSLMKKLDPDSVRSDLGPGSPNYGKKSGTAKAPPKAQKPAAKSKATRSGKVRKTTVVAKVWDLGTPEEQVMQLLDGRKIDVTRDVNGRRTKPVAYLVKSIKTIGPAKSGGRAIQFLDEDGKSRTINLRDVAVVH